MNKSNGKAQNVTRIKTQCFARVVFFIFKENYFTVQNKNAVTRFFFDMYHVF